MVRLRLPWPPAKLSTRHQGGHWASTWGAKKKYKNDCWVIAKTVPKPQFQEGYIHLNVTFVPPARYRFDEDNLIARMKYGFDGIAKAWNVDDVRFRVNYHFAPAQRPGEVIVTYDDAAQSDVAGLHSIKK